jgi:hypothetical protein
VGAKRGAAAVAAAAAACRNDGRFELESRDVVFVVVVVVRSSFSSTRG